MTLVEINPFLLTLADHGRDYGDAVALSEASEDLTYAQVCEQVSVASSALRDAGVRPGDRVALVASNSNQYLVAAFAVWELRGVLVTVYPSSGMQDLAYCLAGSGAVLAIADDACRVKVTQAAEPSFMVVSLGEVTAGHLSTSTSTTVRDLPARSLPVGTDPDLALICYTSGSTARPKAVMHTATGLFLAARSYAEVWHLGPDDKTVVSLPMAWAFGLVTTSMATLYAGGTVLPLPRSRPELLIAAIGRGGTFMAGVTSMYAHMVEYLDTLPRRPDLSSLRLCISGGEPRNETVFARWAEATGRHVHDVYAASECFPVVTYDPVRDPEPVHGSSGKVVKGAQMRLVAPDGSAVDIGAAGEALWRGPAMFVGYWGDPEQTSKALTADGWYRTSDLVRVDDHGYVYVQGRLSDMIIRSGSNVSPAEVEGVLRAHRSVRAAAVVGIPDPMVGQRVVAVVIPADHTTFDPADLRAHCAHQLANYKVPAEFVVAGELPVNAATGKLDRRALAADLTSQGVS